MKNNILLLISIIFLLTVSCQEEQFEITKKDAQNLTVESPLINLISRVAQNVTSKDNVIDGTSCFKVELPVSIIVNGIPITVNIEDDYQKVQNLIHPLPNLDVIDFVYPISIVYRDFHKEKVLNTSQLEDIIDDCDDDNDGFEEIECVKIKFPITINSYNANNQFANVISIYNDVDLYAFMQKIKDSDLISIKYPISIINDKGQTIEILNNISLEENIENCVINSGVINAKEYVSYLTKGKWRITYFFDDINKTLNFQDYEFIFLADGTLTVYDKAAVLYKGTWSIFKDNDELKLELDFDDSKLEAFEYEWKIIEFVSTSFRLKEHNDSTGKLQYLYFKKKE